ncbi:MAG: type II toxin-antitoxin system HipA family toxin [Deltaproteobacteria bacterium]|nr:type II toxin-antitoxin system HipA family toxin [Deltaproteobacteria bacterium]
MEKEIWVYVDLKGVPHLAGRLWTRLRKNKESATFEYDKNWLEYPERFSLDPVLTLDPGPFQAHPGQILFGALGDSAPDRWGRSLMRRAERRRAEHLHETPRTLWETDYLLGVSDEARQGALRFSIQKGGPFLASGDTKIPPLLELPKLLAATEHLLSKTDTDEELQLLLVPGSSLGGARPKASVRDRDGVLSIAKFPRQDDDINVTLWEALALTLAKKAGISVPVWRLEKVAGRTVILLSRFDRAGKIRIPFLSAMSMLNAKDNETRSYLEIAESLRRFGASPKEDMMELWRRIVFNILISNTDDHLRNHGFLYEGPRGWRLSPAYDMNPVPTDIKRKILSTAINLEDTTASVDLAMEVYSYFDLNLNKASEILKEVRNSVKTWREEALKIGLKKTEINRMESAFEI